MNDLQTPNQSLAKILIPTLVFAVTMLIPWWYWGSQNYYDAQCRQESASNGSIMGTTSTSNKNPCPKASYAKQKAYEAPWYDWALIVITAVYTTFAILQWKAIEKQATIAGEAAIISKRQMELAHRPWVDIDVTPVSLTFRNGMQLRVVLSVKNIGGSPSIKTTVEGAVEPFSFGTDTISEVWKNFVERTERSNLRNLMGQTVFPNTAQPSLHDSTYHVPEEKIQDCLLRSSQANVEGIIMAVLMVSVTYQFHFDEGPIHQTAYLLNVWKKTAEGMRSVLIKPSEGDVAAGDIMFTVHIPTGMKAT